MVTGSKATGSAACTSWVRRAAWQICVCAVCVCVCMQAGLGCVRLSACIRFKHTAMLPTATGLHFMLMRGGHRNGLPSLSVSLTHSLLPVSVLSMWAREDWSVVLNDSYIFYSTNNPHSDLKVSVKSKSSLYFFLFVNHLYSWSFCECFIGTLYSKGKKHQSITKSSYGP